MYHLLQIDFPFNGPWGEEMTREMTALAESIAEEPGLVWKIWTENRAAGEAGGIYLFEDAERAKAYLDKHTRRLARAGIEGTRGRIFEVNEGLSRLDQAPMFPGRSAPDNIATP